MIPSAVSAAVSFAIGCLGIYLFIGRHFLLAVACHVVASGIGRRAAILTDSRRLGRHAFQTAVAFCIPFVGGGVSFFLSEAVKRKKTGTLADEFAIYLNDAASFRESVPEAAVEAPDSESIIPLADILANPVSQEEQRIAVENLASMETPAAMDILRKVIDSDGGEGRFFAMTALSQMEEKLLSKLQRQEEELASGRTSGPGILVETARTYIDFSYYQLAQDNRRSDYLTRARELLEGASAMPDAPSDIQILLGRVRLLEFDGRKAAQAFNDYLALAPDSQAGWLWRAEANFMLGEYGRVREDCQRARRLGKIPEHMRATVDFWTGADGREGEGGSQPVIEDMIPELLAEGVS